MLKKIVTDIIKSFFFVFFSLKLNFHDNFLITSFYKYYPK